MPDTSRINAITAEAIQWRRDFHRNPELLFDVHRTASVVAEKLKAFGVDEIVTGLGRTGVVGIIKGKLPGNKVIGLRADMDALPIEEETNLPHRSTVPGKMHACGHDGHTAMLLGAARYLAETRDFTGTVAVIFQPAEEGGGGGREMCADGLMAR
ncbi:MAG: amidohydrolase, partial [Bosea sp. (in: a-proteobacteria)]